MIEQVKNFIQRHHLIRPGQHVLVAVSGGADSIALLYVLRELTRQFRLRLTVAHLNHKIRGKDAEQDASFVRQLARRLQLDFVGGRVNVPRLARRLGISLEMAGRKARYDFFEKTALARGCHLVATAHTADDNAETILLMLARGCGLPGLTGIAPVSRIGKITVIRPFLGTDRRAIEKYLRAHKISWREDASNADDAFRRNRVRHELLPLLEKKYNKNIRQTLGRLADVLRNENEYLNGLAGAAYSESRLENGRVMNCAVLIKHHPAIRRRVLRQWLLSRGVNPETIDYQSINSIDGLLAKSGRSRAIGLAGGIIIRRNYERLTIGRARASPHRHYLFGGAGGSRPTFQKFLNIKINIPGITILPGTGLRVKVEIAPGVDRARTVFGKFPVRASMSLKKWKRRQILARPWRPGDRMRPYGLDGSKKIQDIFSDAKFPAAMRHSLPIFECGGEVIWIPGYRIADGWQVTDSASNALQLTVDWA